MKGSQNTLSETWDLFLCASLRAASVRARTAEIAKAASEHGLSCFVPHERLPLDAGLSVLEIAEGNRSGIAASRNVLVCLDSAGEGVFYELGYADGLGKPVYLYREEMPVDRGKIIEGRVALADKSPYDRESIKTLFELLKAMQA